VHVYLETGRLILRRFTPDDVDLVTALDADPAVMRYINGGRPTPRDEIRDDYLPWWLAYWAGAMSGRSTSHVRTGSRAESTATSSTR
jgi:RimJ/RimL family protein N-acetyltransferase